MTAPEHYGSSLAYVLARGKFALLRRMLRPLCRWKPLENPRPGYSIVIGVPWALWDLIDIPLLSLRRAHRHRCHEIILAVDTTQHELELRFGTLAVASKVKSYADLRLRLMFYTPAQLRRTRRIGWNWVDCWLTWCMGVAGARTRHVLLHDFDAVVLDPGFLEHHYQTALSTGSAFVGIQRDLRHQGQQHPDLLMTAELMLDAQALRSRFHAVDLFNAVRRHNGLRLQYDILRDVQMRMPDSARTLHEIRGEQIVHPSQVVSQWRGLQQSADPFRPRGYSPLFVIPYFRQVSGDSLGMRAITDALLRGERIITIEGGQLDVSQLDHAGCDWIAKQIERLDGYFVGTRTPQVQQYCSAIRSIAPEEPVAEITVVPRAPAQRQR